MPPLRSLDTRSRSVDPSALLSLLQLPALSGLAALTAGPEQLDFRCLRRLATDQRALHTLHLGRPGGTTSGFFAALPLLAALTDLSVVGRPGWSARFIGQCAGLRRLALDSLCDADWPEALRPPALSRLESLSLRLAPADLGRLWAETFARAPALRSLALRRCFGVDELLPVVAAHCPALRELRISPEQLEDAPGEFGSAQPAAAEMERLLAAMPKLAALVLQLPPPPMSADEGDDSAAPWMPPPEEAAAQWQRAHAHFESFRQLHPQRVRLSIQ